jgi:hypothetical protein
MASNESSTKISRTKRKPSATKSPVAMTEQREEMLYMVARYGYVSTPQLAKRFFGGNKQSSQLADTMRKLFDAGYIDRFQQPSTASEAKNMPLISVLTQKGAEFIAGSRGIDMSRLQVHSASDQPKAAYFEHLLMVNDVRVIFELACEQSNYNLVWLDERTIRKQRLYGEVLLSSDQGKGEKTSNIPDGFFSIKTTAGWLSFFLEIDRGTEKIAIIHKKAQVYLAYEQTSHYAQHYGATTQSGDTAPLFVLLITNAAKRRDNVSTSLGKAFPSQPFLYAAYPELLPESVLSQPIWYAPNLNQAVSLIVIS